MTSQLATAPFGRTGHESTRVIFGAASLGGMRQDRADEVLATLLELGVNHIDTAAAYGESELRVGAVDARAPGPLLPRHQDRRAPGRPGPARSWSARWSASRSTPSTSIQLHNLVEPDEWEVAHGPGGAVEALARARDEGLVRHIGVTGHGTRIAGMHLRSLERFDFDSVLLPYSYAGLQDPAYRADVEQLLAVCAERQVAVQTIKGIARRRWPDDYDGRRFSWYQPLEEADAIGRAVRWVLGQPAGVPEHVERRPAAAHRPRGGHRRRGPADRRRDGGRHRRPRRATAVRRRRPRTHLSA